jgi:hypothetical protein
MKERPILFSAPMVRALLDGSKTQTRRLVKPAPDIRPPVTSIANIHGGFIDSSEVVIANPYGQPGDRLWVRETWGVVSNAWDEDGNLVDWTPNRPATAITEMRFGQGYYSGHAIYAADGSHEWAGDDDGGGEPRSAWHPSIHMPRAASRILLEVVSVRVEQLNGISADDCRAEGIDQCDGLSASAEILDLARRMGTFSDEVLRYATLWEQINGAGSWGANPWVWVVEFKRVAP